MKTMVVSGINLFEGGPLSIYYDCLDSIIEKKLNEKYKVIAFVHKKSLFFNYMEKINIVELPKSRKCYLFRLWYEYIYFYLFSKKNQIDIWVSLHDITPNVKTNYLYTYCHNPSPYLKNRKTAWKYSKTVFFMSFLYKYIYKVNIRKNDYVIVQQEWIRREFEKMYKISNIIVALPELKRVKELQKHVVDSDKYVYVYVAFPRLFKNFEVILAAAEILEEKNKNFEIWLTIDGTENKYSKDLKQKYGYLKNIKWLGIQSRENVMKLYKQSNCLIYPSFLETWGLPISEYKETGNAIILADLPYAHETIGKYEKVIFFNPNNANELAEIMVKEMESRNRYIVTDSINVREPFAQNWNDLFEQIIPS